MSTEFDRVLAKIPKNLFDVPMMDWMVYEGDHYVVSLNLEKSLKCHRPIVDIHHCMTKALNNCVLKSVNYKPELFKESPLNKN